MAAGDACIKPFSNTIILANMALKWMSGILRRRWSGGSEQRKIKLQVHFLFLHFYVYLNKFNASFLLF